MNYQKQLKQCQEKHQQKILKINLSVLNGAKYFSLGIFQNYLVLLPTKKYIKYFSSTTRIESWKSKGMSNIYI